MSESENQVQAPEEDSPPVQEETFPKKQQKAKNQKHDQDVSEEDEVQTENQNHPIANLTLSQMVLGLPEHIKQSIHDTMVSYVHNKMERDTILHSVFQKAEKALVEEFHKN